MRDIFVNDKQRLTLINPAYMTRQLAEMTLKVDGVHFHITSLNPINPHNAPTPLERKALLRFERGDREFEKKIGDNEFFYMAPLITKKACLRCHAKQGYKVGDIRGGISVIVPYFPVMPIAPLALGHFIIALLGTVFIVILGKKLTLAYDEIKRQAVYDALTGIYNRREFTERIMREYNRGRRVHHPISLIMGDVDWFKGYNDTYGHTMGDVCLQKIAQGIQNSLRRSGDFCARYGGEEFVAILPNTDCNGARYVAEMIHENIKGLNMPHKDSPYGYVTMSLGIATEMIFSGDNWEDLVKRADMALYEAKRKGRNRVEVSKECA